MTDPLTIYAAVIAMGGLGWQVYPHVQASRTRIEVTVAGTWSFDAHPMSEDHMIAVRLVNRQAPWSAEAGSGGVPARHPAMAADKRHGPCRPTPVAAACAAAADRDATGCASWLARVGRRGSAVGARGPSRPESRPKLRDGPRRGDHAERERDDLPLASLVAGQLNQLVPVRLFARFGEARRSHRLQCAPGRPLAGLVSLGRCGIVTGV
jgi:hypothetical protein